MNYYFQSIGICVVGALSLTAFPGCEQELDITRTAYRCNTSSECVPGFVCRDLGDGRGAICVDDALVAGGPDASVPDDGGTPESDAHTDADASPRPPGHVVDLAEAVETNAVHKIVGERTEQQFGWSVAGGIDFNNDGFSDFAVGAPMVESGTVYVFFGRSGRAFPDNAQNAELSAGVSPSGSNRIGVSIAPADDFVGTVGYDELLIGAKGIADAPGAAYLLPGSDMESPGEWIDLDGEGRSAEILAEQSGSRAGHAIADVGDVNADGRRDILIGAPLYSDSSSTTGAAYLVLGNRTTGADRRLTEEPAVRYVGMTRDGWAGEEVAGAGDFNGDGYSDFLIGAPEANFAYLIFGDEEIGAADASPTLDQAGVIFPGVDGSRLGSSLAAIGDVNADGRDDILIGANGGRGEVYLILGRSDLEATYFDMNSVDLTFLPGSPDNIAPSGLNVGAAVALAGDVDNDGLGDILIGASGVGAGDLNSRGEVYLVSGATLLAHLDQETFYLADADAQFVGEAAGDHLGRALAGVGDVDDDGCDDVLMGVRSHGIENGGSSRRGAAYLVFGPAKGAEYSCD